jgi:uncharacterized membrane protein
MFVRRDRVLPIDLSTEEAFKLLLSGGNYVPGEVRLTAHEVPAALEIGK